MGEYGDKILRHSLSEQLQQDKSAFPNLIVPLHGLLDHLITSAELAGYPEENKEEYGDALEENRLSFVNVCESLQKPVGEGDSLVLVSAGEGGIGTSLMKYRGHIILIEGGYIEMDDPEESQGDNIVEYLKLITVSELGAEVFYISEDKVDSAYDPSIESDFCRTRIFKKLGSRVQSAGYDIDFTLTKDLQLHKSVPSAIQDSLDRVRLDVLSNDREDVRLDFKSLEDDIRKVLGLQKGGPAL